MKSIEQALISDIESLRGGDGCVRAGLPYFDGTYGRDSIITAWQMLGYDPGIASCALRFLANHQGVRVDHKTEEEPGKILHVYDYRAHGPVHSMSKFLQSWLQGFPYYGTVDATPLFVILAEETFNRVSDRASVHELWPNIVRAMDWLSEFGDVDGDGLVEYSSHNPFGNRRQNWKDTAVYIKMKAPVAAVEVQGYAYMAYRSAAKLAMVLDVDGRDWNTRAEKLRHRFCDRFWMDDKKFFALALDGKKAQVKEIASNAGHLLATGILDQDTEGEVVARLFQPDMLTEYGLRTHSTNSRFFGRSCTLGPIWPHDNWWLWLGLVRHGYHTEADILRTGLLRAYEKLGCMPEYFDVVDGQPRIVPRILGTIGRPCLKQAWASGALLDMMRGRKGLSRDTS